MHGAKTFVALPASAFEQDDLARRGLYQGHI
jgi:hypothetical protein